MWASYRPNQMGDEAGEKAGDEKPGDSAGEYHERELAGLLEQSVRASRGSRRARSTRSS